MTTNSKPKFSKTFCSQCGQEFGPGNHGFSHCSEHQGKIIGQSGLIRNVKTPRTDAMLVDSFVADGGERYVHHTDYDCLADLCRELERALAAQPDGRRDGASFETMERMMPEGLHPQTKELVFRFACAMADKLHAAEKKYGYCSGWADPGWMDECRVKLREHVEKGDPRDVANYCAFLWHHKEPTHKPSVSEPDGGVEEPARIRFLRMLRKRGGATGEDVTILDHIDRLTARVRELERDRDAARELLSMHNLGGMTDYNDGPIKRALAAERARDEANRILDETLEYLSGKEDVTDGSDGPRPNAAMNLANEIRWFRGEKV